MPCSINPDGTKIEIEKLGHTVTNIWNIKQYRTKLFQDLKRAPNNKDISNMDYIQQCKIKFEPPKHKTDIAQRANSQRHGYTKSYCHRKQRCFKCAGDHLTNQRFHKVRSSDVRFVLCGGNHPTNCKENTIYKVLCPPFRGNKSNLPYKFNQKYIF
jgi:hypothetical protein